MSKLRVQEIAHSNGTTAFTVDASGKLGRINAKDGSSAFQFSEYNNGAALWLDGADGDFTGGDYYNIFANNNGKFSIGYAGAEHMFLDSSGRVTMPYQPSFMVYGGWSYDANYIWKGFATVDHNIGGHWNNTIGRFTAPIAGRYMIYATVHNSSTSVYHLWAFAKNGGLTSGNWVQDYNNSAGANTTSKQQVWNLAANDYLEVVSNATYANGYTGGYVTVGGYLVG